MHASNLREAPKTAGKKTNWILPEIVSPVACADYFEWEIEVGIVGGVISTFRFCLFIRGINRGGGLLFLLLPPCLRFPSSAFSFLFPPPPRSRLLDTGFRGVGTRWKGNGVGSVNKQGVILYFISSLFFGGSRRRPRRKQGNVSNMPQKAIDFPGEIRHARLPELGEG